MYLQKVIYIDMESGSVLVNDLDYRSFILLPSPDKVISDAEQNHSPRHQGRVVHRRRRGRIRRWEEAENPNHNGITARKRVVGDSKSTGDAPRAPDQLRFSRCGVDFAG